jgi:uncharacterized protein YuzE
MDDNMKISYDRDEDILMIELNPVAVIDYAEQTGPVIVHLDHEQHPVLLEILRASEFMSGTVKASMRAEPVTV